MGPFVSYEENEVLWIRPLVLEVRCPIDYALPADPKNGSEQWMCPPIFFLSLLNPKLSRWKWAPRLLVNSTFHQPTKSKLSLRTFYFSYHKDKLQTCRRHIRTRGLVMLELQASTMKKHALKNVSNCLNTNICSRLETSGGQSSKLYLNIVHFSNSSVIRHLWQLKKLVFCIGF